MSRVKQRPKFNSSKRGIATAVEKVHRVNESIDVPEVRLIGEDGQQIGIMPTEQALEYAQREDFDLVEISPNAEPPVCRLLDYGKFLYNASKRRQDARRKQKHLVVKEIKFRPSTDVGDYEVKLNKLKDFLNSGNKTKVTMRFRGREFAHVDLGVDLLMRVKDDLAELATVEQEPSLEGRQMIMVLAPVKNPIKREVNATS